MEMKLEGKLREIKVNLKERVDKIDGLGENCAIWFHFPKFVKFWANDQSEQISYS